MSRLRLLLVAAALALAWRSGSAQAPSTSAEGFLIQTHRMTAPCRTVLQLDDTHLAIGRGPLLVILDISEPAAPQVVSETPLSGIILDLERSGNTLFAATGSSGLRVVDIGNIYSPKEISSFARGYMDCLAAHPNGKILYATLGDSTLMIIRVEDPYHLKGVSHYQVTNTFFSDLLCTGGVLLAAAGSKGVIAFSLDVPTRPKRLSTFKDMGSADFLALDGRDLAVSGEDAYGNMGVALIRYPTWDAPALKGFLNTETQVLDLARVPSHPTLALLALGDAGYSVADLTDPALPSIAFHGAAPAPVTAAEPALSSPTAFLSCGYNGTWRADFMAIPEPVLTKLMDANVVARAIATKGQIAYVSSEDKNIEVWDFSSPLEPELLKVLQTPLTAQHLLVKGDILVASCQTSGFSIFSISDPADPVLLSDTDPHGDGQGSTLCSDLIGTLLAIGDGVEGVRFFDISNPAVPHHYDQSDWNATSGYVRWVAFQDDQTLWCTQSVAGIVSLRLGTPGTAPAELGKVSLGNILTGPFSISENYMFASGSGGVDVVDLTDPAKPQHSATLGSGQALATGVWDGNLYVARGTSGFEEWDISDLPQSYESRLFNTPGLASAIARTDSGTFLLLDGEGGVWTMVLSDCDGPTLRLPCEGQVLPFQAPALFVWAPGSSSRFRVEVSRDPSFSGDSKIIISGSDNSDLLKDPSWVPSSSKWKKILKQGRGTTLYWRVVMFDSKGKKTGVSEVRGFGL